MSEQSEREWKSYLLSKGVFANALRFAHLEKPEEVDRTSFLYTRLLHPRRRIAVGIDCDHSQVLKRSHWAATRVYMLQFRSQIAP